MMMGRFQFLLACALALLASSITSAETVEHFFHVQNLTVQRLCHEQVITTINGTLPGPVISVREGDNLVIHVVNQSPYNITIHWHGVFQLLSAWADGPSYVTQCPIRPGRTYAYKFNITGQEGTLFWHAHVSWLRATVYGALIIKPRFGNSYPFPSPYEEFPILLGEYWDANVVDIENQALATGVAPKISNAFTINGQPGDLYPCSQTDTYKLEVIQGKTYMLRIINAALNNQLFFKIANHKMKVVAIDAAYTETYVTDVIILSPGQTTDVLFTADQPLGSYYMAARPYFSAQGLPFDNTTTSGIIVYQGAKSATPIMPALPAFNDTPTAYKFYTNITGFPGGPHWVPVPLQVDEHMFITFGGNLAPCEGGSAKCGGIFGQRFSASMNNESFQLPSKLSMLQAFYSNNKKGIYTTDFPDNPPLVFDYTNPSNALNQSIIFAPKSTKVKTLKYGSTVEIVLQSTALIATESHPIHFHGFSFHVLAQGFGNYDTENDPRKFNLVNPQIRNTIAVTTGGWAVIRFTANNPGIWYVHCHIELHLSWGLAMAFEVENGRTPSSTLPPPPIDLPKC